MEEPTDITSIASPSTDARKSSSRRKSALTTPPNAQLTLSSVSTSACMATYASTLTAGMLHAARWSRSEIVQCSCVCKFFTKN